MDLKHERSSGGRRLVLTPKNDVIAGIVAETLNDMRDASPGLEGITFSESEEDGKIVVNGVTSDVVNLLSTLHPLFARALPLEGHNGLRYTDDSNSAWLFDPKLGRTWQQVDGPRGVVYDNPNDQTGVYINV